jgi:hypothetical protein
MEAVETDKYGFFWECPNKGVECTYRHSLPAGMVIIKSIPLEKPDDDDMTLEEKIDKERGELKSEGLTRVTLATFQAWKEKKAKQLEEEVEEKRVQAAKKQGNKGLNVMSGRMLFKYDPTMFQDDDNALDADEYDVIDEEEKEEESKVDESVFKEEIKEEEEEPDFD